jgi:hypothetical protein
VKLFHVKQVSPEDSTSIVTNARRRQRMAKKRRPVSRETVMIRRIHPFREKAHAGGNSE